jgi:hypothetical protein
MPKHRGSQQQTLKSGQEQDYGKVWPVKTSRKPSPMTYFDTLCDAWMMWYFTSMMKLWSNQQNQK